MAMTPEGRWKKKTDILLKELGVWFFPPQAGPYGSSGIPDRIAVVRGLFVGIEVKADRTKKPTALQQKCMRDIEAAGGRCFVVYDQQSLDALRSFIVSVMEDHDRLESVRLAVRAIEERVKEQADAQGEDRARADDLWIG